MMVNLVYREIKKEEGESEIRDKKGSGNQMSTRCGLDTTPNREKPGSKRPSEAVREHLN